MMIRLKQIEPIPHGRLQNRQGSEEQYHVSKDQYERLTWLSSNRLSLLVDDWVEVDGVSAADISTCTWLVQVDIPSLGSRRVQSVTAVHNGIGSAPTDVVCTKYAAVGFGENHIKVDVKLVTQGIQSLMVLAVKAIPGAIVSVQRSVVITITP